MARPPAELQGLDLEAVPDRAAPGGDTRTTSSRADVHLLQPGTGEETAPQLPARLISRLRRRILPVLWCCFVVSMAERTNIAIAELQMGCELGLSMSTFGLAAGIFFLPFALAQVPAAHLALRVGARRFIVCVLLLWSVCSFATAFVRTPSSLVALRFALGLSESGFVTTVIVYLSAWFPGRAFGQASAIFMTGAAAGAALASPAASATLVAMDGALGLSGWRWVFIAQAAVR